VGTCPRAERGRVGWITSGNAASGAGVEAFDTLASGAGGGSGLTALGATDSLLGRVDAAVTVAWGTADITGDFAGSVTDGTVGDVRAGVTCRLVAFDCGFKSGLGVLGPAGASGICTEVVFVVSGGGTGVSATGESSPGVEASDIVPVSGAGTRGGNMRMRFGSGGLVLLSSDANDCSLVAAGGDSTAAAGDDSRFRLLEGLAADLFRVLGVALKAIFFKVFAAPIMRFVTSSNTFASSLACRRCDSLLDSLSSDIVLESVSLFDVPFSIIVSLVNTWFGSSTGVNVVFAVSAEG
jgi:hypothetical protein